MLRHYVAVALRNTVRTKLYAAISVAGLAIGFGAAALIGFYVHDELTFDRWIPNHERIYQVSPTLSTGLPAGAGPSDLGQWLAADYPQLQAVTRLFRATAFFAPSNRADVRFNEQITWADANVFDVFRFPVAAGSLDGALTQPDSLVLTRRVAEKYFGAAGTAVGETLLMNGMQPMTVTAVIENLPSNTHLSYLTVIGAGHAPYSPSALQDRTPMPVFGGKLWNSATYALLAPGERLEPVRDGIATMIDRHAPAVLGGTLKASEVWKLAIRPIRTIHLSAGSTVDPESQRYGPVYTVTAIGVLIVLVASINFVNLLTALGLRRALEVGVRKAIGAQRGDLFAQFMTESFLYVTLGAAAGLGLARLALGPLNVFLGRTIDFSTFADWRVGAGALGFLAATALLAGVYPSLVLSAFRPATVTKGARGGRGQGVVRQSLVVVQFAILIALLIATGITYGQMSFGMREALRQDGSPVVLVYAQCREALKNELARAPGVLGASCAMTIPQMGFQLGSAIKVGDRDPLSVRYLGLDFGFFDVYGLELAAGRDFDAKLGTDAPPDDNVWTSPESIIVNETAARALGFANPNDAVGQVTSFSHLFRQPATFTPAHDAAIVGVAKDFQIGSVQDAIPPAVFYVDPANARVLSLKLDGRSTPEALDAINRVWAQFGEPRPIQREFFEQSIERLYVDLVRQTTLFTVFAAVAVLIAVLGLVGLAAHAAVSRTKEIGIRKTLGGGRWAITRLLLWQFSRPVLLANLIAWPAAYWAMSVWLNGFARRVELDWRVFAGAAAATLVVAVASVLVHTWGMAGTRPVAALRYE
ncbi:MAG TPA: FtsX-like permease family protein [Gammaproteobacteria bacterium]|nr:FtsX-like permease family protein [Gammaproteobacteria bacterium]